MVIPTMEIGAQKSQVPWTQCMSHLIFQGLDTGLPGDHKAGGHEGKWKWKWKVSQSWRPSLEGNELNCAVCISISIFWWD